jgi:hypothetical protein
MWPFLIPTIIAALSAGAAGIGAIKQRQQNKADASGANVDLVNTTLPSQQKLIDMLGQLGLSGAEGMQGNIMGDPYDGFGNIAQNQEKNFNERMLPGLAEGFTQMGGQRSGAYPQAIGELRGAFDQNLANQRMQFGNQRLGQQQSYLNILAGPSMQRPFEPLYNQQQNFPWGQILGGLGEAGVKGGQALSSYYANLPQTPKKP